MPILAADGCHVTTVEGIGTVKNDNLHPVQQAMVDLEAQQQNSVQKRSDTVVIIAIRTSSL